MIALIDGDILIYTVAFQVEQAIDWGDDMWTLHADMKEARQRLDLEISSFRELLSARSVRIALSDSTERNFRKRLWPEYKSNRTQRKPVVYSALRAYVEDVWKGVVKKGIEADDLLGIWSTEKPGKTVIVSADKDLRTIPGLIYSPTRHDLGVSEITKAEADRTHLIQTLTGDRTDGYPGCPGIGEKRAEAIADGGWSAVVESYEKAGLGEEYALTQARMAYILRHGDYKRGKVRLWTPSVSC
jgi:DNA polymerase-1